MNLRRPSPTQRTNRLILTIILIPVLLILVVTGSALAQELTGPAVTPNSADGLAIFAERCANCHGPLGMGDGELAANLPAPPRNYTDLEFLRQAVPADLFNTITNGRIESGMPPFGPASSNPLSEESRWQAIAAVYSLGTPAESVAQGQTVYEANCLACHGESGQGDGAEAADLADQP
jgi:mono/diheme cytochrome c family protein